MSCCQQVGLGSRDRQCALGLFQAAYRYSGSVRIGRTGYLNSPILRCRLTILTMTPRRMNIELAQRAQTVLPPQPTAFVPPLPTLTRLFRHFSSPPPAVSALAVDSLRLLLLGHVSNGIQLLPAPHLTPCKSHASPFKPVNSSDLFPSGQPAMMINVTIWRLS